MPDKVKDQANSQISKLEADNELLLRAGNDLTWFIRMRH